MKRWWLIVGLVLVVMVPVQAATIVSTFGPADSFDAGSNWAISGPTNGFIIEQHLAAPFTPTSSFSFDSADLALFLSSGLNQIQVVLMNDVGGLPGSAIETLTLGGIAGTAIYSVNSVLNPILNAGTPYWLAGLPGGSDTIVGWHLNDLGILGHVNSQPPPPGWNFIAGETREAFRVNGTRHIPEPSTYLLFGLGALAMMVLRRRRKAA